MYHTIPWLKVEHDSSELDDPQVWLCEVISVLTEPDLKRQSI